MKPLYSEQSRDPKYVHYTGVFTQEDHQGFHLHASSSESYSKHNRNKVGLLTNWLEAGGKFIFTFSLLNIWSVLTFQADTHLFRYEDIITKSKTELMRTLILEFANLLEFGNLNKAVT